MHREALIEDLEDDHLLIIFSKLDPLPDLFKIAQCCKRFHRLATGGELYLKVGYERQNIAGKRELAFPSISAAVHESRRGDTIVISPAQRHCVDSVVARHPLRLFGGGQNPEETVLVCTSSFLPALSFRASGEVCNLSMSAGKSPCLEQCRGNLKIEKCILMGHPERGLEHLSSPLKFNPFGAFLVPQADEILDSLEQRKSSNAVRAQQENRVHLSVNETVIRGKNGMTAVDTSAANSLIKDVRVVQLAKDTLYWFTVSATHRSYFSRALKEVISCSPNLDEDSDLPAWAKQKHQIFPDALRDPSRQKAEDASDSLRNKAKTWTSREAFI